MIITKEQNIGALVANDYRTSAVFKQYNIDFCCNGNRSIEEACANDQLETTAVIKELQQVINTNKTSSVDFTSWSIDLLADYIEKKHHRYVRSKIKEIQAYLVKICAVHGNHHPELFQIKELFDESGEELIAHMQKEEQILFPFIKEMMIAQEKGITLLPPLFGNMENPVAMMHEEHDNEGERFRKIAALSNNYSVPADGCNTYRVTYAMLREFEEDLHLHIHLENNILFPRALQVEAIIYKK